jgi:hypothetical protein
VQAHIYIFICNVLYPQYTYRINILATHLNRLIDTQCTYRINSDNLVNIYIFIIQ